MERSVLGMKLKDKIPNTVIREKNKVNVDMAYK